jgi:hypothetical protein
MERKMNDELKNVKCYKPETALPKLSDGYQWVIGNDMCYHAYKYHKEYENDNPHEFKSTGIKAILITKTDKSNDELREILKQQINMTLLHNLTRPKMLVNYFNHDCSGKTEYINFLDEAVNQFISVLQPYIDQKVEEERETGKERGTRADN